jgi:hypothetical protein
VKNDCSNTAKVVDVVAVMAFLLFCAAPIVS